MSAGARSSGLVIVDKPSGWTSHDVVGRLRRLAGTRKVGHAGTLDPMATGVLVVGVNRATRLLGHLVLADKEYLATIRLGSSTVTDDAEGDVVASTRAGHLTDVDIRSAMAPLTGDIRQVPSAVSAIKVDGVRSYTRVRAGEAVELPARPVHVAAFEPLELRVSGDAVDVDVRVECSSGTYVRALARDLGAALGVGGHLTALRRTRVGGFTLAEAHTLDSLAESFVMLDLDTVARRAFASVEVDTDVERLVRSGRALDDLELGSPEPHAVFGPDGTFLALYEPSARGSRPVAVFATLDAS